MSSRKITLLTSIGACLEYYDFAIYALLAAYISKNFFPNDNHYVALMATYVIFAVGYLARPIGGVIFGMFGDRVGRKKLLLLSIFIMAFATFLMGAIPSYQTLGIYASLIFLLLRLLQGISFGAELPASLTFLVEHVKKKSRGTNCGFMVSSVGIGVALGTFVSYLLSVLMGDINMFKWGWRVPFLLGGALAVVGYLTRRNTEETPAFLKLESVVKNSLLDIFKNHLRAALLGFGVVLFPASFVVFFLCIPSYLKYSFGYSYTNIYLIITLGYLWSSVLIPIFGWISDRISRKYLLLSVVVMFILFAIPLFGLLANNNVVSLVIFVFIYQTIIAVMASCYFPMLAENFPTNVRFTGVALCYNSAYVVASTIPIVTNYLYKTAGDNKNIILLMIILAAITALSAFLIKNNHKCDITF